MENNIVACRVVAGMNGLPDFNLSGLLLLGFYSNYSLSIMNTCSSLRVLINALGTAYFRSQVDD